MHRPAVGADGGLLLHAAGDAGARARRRSPSGGRRPRDRRSDRRCRRRECDCRRDPNRPAAASGGPGGRSHIDHRRRTGRAAVTRIVGRHHRARSGIGAATVRINRAGAPRRAAIARIVRATAPGRAAASAVELWRVRRLVVIVQRVEIGCAGAAAVIDGVATGHIGSRSRRIDRAGGRRIALLRMGKRGSRRASGNGSTNRQNAVDHHRFCIDPKPHRTVNGR